MLAGQEEEDRSLDNSPHGKREGNCQVPLSQKTSETVTRDGGNITYTHCLQVAITPPEGGSRDCPCIEIPLYR